MKEQPIRKLSAAQYKRIQDHSATATVTADGTLEIDIVDLITPKGDLKKNNLISVIPSSEENIAEISTVPCYFDDLSHINVILTNACNLSCSYCYEQHNKDFGRFSPDTLKQIYDFQHNCNNLDGKLFQFFGGEPLIHKQLILDFINKYHTELEQNRNTIGISMITNGILLSQEFIAEYFQYKFAGMSISLDTINSEVDHREIGQDNINQIVERLGDIPTFHKDSHMVSIRCTISVETAPFIKEFAKVLYDQGMRAMVIHPLTMSSVDGFINWPPELWDQLHSDIVEIINTFPNFEIQFSEGVGLKHGSNCMVGSDMIAVDGSGDYSGCYFFTNHKATSQHTILGNLLRGEVYTDRYVGFQNVYEQMFEEEEQCKSCDLQGFCYQCPAGNLDTGDGRLFRPDDMCQDIVRLFLTLQGDITKKSFKIKFDNIVATLRQVPEQQVFAKSIVHLMYKKITGHHLPVGSIDHLMDRFPDYEQILTLFVDHMEDPSIGLLEDPELFMITIPEDTKKTDIKTFYEKLLVIQGIDNNNNKHDSDVSDITKRAFYLTLIHMLILNHKGDKLSEVTK